VKRLASLSTFIVMALLAPISAWADCADAPAPKVDWGRCILDDRDFHGVDFTGVYLRDTQALRADLAGARWIHGKKICAAGSIGSCQ
jgi:uncharacterized protein YjbI with pentapeptide repeats